MNHFGTFSREGSREISRVTIASFIYTGRTEDSQGEKLQRWAKFATAMSPLKRRQLQEGFLTPAQFAGIPFLRQGRRNDRS